MGQGNSSGLLSLQVPDNSLEALRIHYRNVESDYSVEHTIGTGFSGSVALATCRRSGQMVAVKTYNRDSLTAERQKLVESEIALHLAADHPGIAQLLGVYVQKHQVSLVTEYCSYRSFCHPDTRVRVGVLDEEDVRGLSFQMFEVLAFLHERGIVHMDIKLENWLLAPSTPEAAAAREEGRHRRVRVVPRRDLRMKLVDFGFAQRLDEPGGSCGLMGTLHYIAPELLSSDGLAPRTPAADIWSLGVVLFVLASGWEFPFQGRTRQALGAEIVSGGSDVDSRLAEKGVSTGCRDLIRRCLERNVDKRISAAEALKHPWLRGGGGEVCDRDVRSPSSLSASAEEKSEVVRRLRSFAQLPPLTRLAALGVAQSLSTHAKETGEADVFTRMCREARGGGGALSSDEFVSVLVGVEGATETELRRLFDTLSRQPSETGLACRVLAETDRQGTETEREKEETTSAARAEGGTLGAGRRKRSVLSVDTPTETQPDGAPSSPQHSGPPPGNEENGRWPAVQQQGEKDANSGKEKHECQKKEGWLGEGGTKVSKCPSEKLSCCHSFSSSSFFSPCAEREKEMFFSDIRAAFLVSPSLSVTEAEGRTEKSGSSADAAGSLFLSPYANDLLRRFFDSAVARQKRQTQAFSPAAGGGETAAKESVSRLHRLIRHRRLSPHLFAESVGLKFCGLGVEDCFLEAFKQTGAEGQASEADDGEGENGNGNVSVSFSEFKIAVLCVRASAAPSVSRCGVRKETGKGKAPACPCLSLSRKLSLGVKKN
uniref:Protein kinase domain-containing protein n=1 Tax=Chromera velia CCMP2878 TaxID=1169474 RepID=A0A0G4FYM1_9ALVE|eukprot:Cvel_3887.t1-p1 / transcript=Cvel_3887.t1 / gene=Cvel_3887 / organism=Chromera_velia_CCMP2878 / gene_product=Serine/threonine-protein kinase PEPKR2, putative / transcript_product=Serine/threonine-protein kinase PEPKR2, putative / location=Cvel_scaffold164:102266-105975(-) / protein_length=769 / sequence_SO=supercontig / SO=protein_coding / is_pseudo=false